MNRVILQVPMNPSMRFSAERIAESFGFTSLQELIRVFLFQLTAKKITFAFRAEEEILTPWQEKVLAKKLRQARKEIAQNRAFKADSVSELFSQLKS